MIRKNARKLHHQKESLRKTPLGVTVRSLSAVLYLLLFFRSCLQAWSERHGRTRTLLTPIIANGFVYSASAICCGISSSRRKIHFGDAMRLRRFHTRECVMPYQACGLDKKNIFVSFRMDLNPRVPNHAVRRVYHPQLVAVYPFGK